MKKFIIILLIVGTVGLAAAWVQLTHKENGIRFKTEKVVRGNIQQTVTATGTVNPVVNVLVGTQVSGTIKEIYVDFNSPVKKGQLIAQIDPATFEAQLEKERANLLAAKANVHKAEAALVDAKRTLNRNKELYPKEIISRNEMETSETAYQSAVAQVSAAKAQVAQIQAALKIAETNLRYTRIVSPVDGIVVSRNVDVGQTVAASFQTPTLFTIAQDLTKMQINTSVDEADIGKIAIDQNAEFTVDAFPDMTFHGKVFQIRNAPITVQNVVTYDVIINVDNSDLKLKPGMTANVSVIISAKENILKVPNAALRFKYEEKDRQKRGEGKKQAEKKDSESKGYSVWIVENHMPRRIRIVPGINDGTYTEVASGDLNEGQDVILESLDKPKEESRPRGPRFF